MTDPQVLRPIVARDAKALNAVRRALTLEYRTPPADNSPAAVTRYAPYRDAARLFAAESRMALAEGHAGAAEQDAEDALDLGGRTGRGGGMIQALLGSAIVAVAAQAAEPPIDRLSAAEAHQAGERLDKIIAQTPTLAETLREESRAFRPFFLKIFNGDVPQEPLADGRPAPQGGVLKALFFFYPKRWTLEAYDQALRELADQSNRPYPRRHDVPIPKEILARALVPTLNSATHAIVMRDARLRLLRVELALQEYRARHGHYPILLDDLQPSCIPAIPADPYGSGPFSYQKQGEAYLLYSWGPDGRDDHGQPMQKLDASGRVPGDIVAGRLAPSAAQPGGG